MSLNLNQNAHKILFFSPYLGIPQHAVPENFLAQSFVENPNLEVEYLTCNRDFQKMCVTMRGFGLEFQASAEKKASICVRCIDSKNIFKKNNRKITYTDLGKYKSIVNPDTINLKRENYFEFSWESIPVGKLSVYDIFVNKKKKSFELTDQEWAELKIDIEYCVWTIESLRNYTAANGLPKAVVIYNTFYSVNAAARAFFEQQNVTVYNVHAGGNLSHFLNTLTCAKKNNIQYIEECKQFWPQVKDSPLNGQLIETVGNHFLEVFKGQSIFAYSAAVKRSAQSELRHFFKISPGSKVILAAMSSYDERFAGEVVGGFSPPTDAIFPNQIEWIKALVEYVRDKPEWHLVIRVHPREFPNKREGLLAPHALELQAEFKDLPKNAIVNWPSDNISIYDLINIVNVGVTAWSSVAKELTILGIPIVNFTEQMPMYPPELVSVGRSKDDYFKRIENAAVEGWSFERIRKAFRWCAIEYEWGTGHFETTYMKRPTNNVSKFIKRIENKFIPTLKISRNIAKNKGNQELKLMAQMIINDANIFAQHKDRSFYLGNVEDETNAIKEVLNSFYSVLYEQNPNTTEKSSGLQSSLKNAQIT